MQLTQRMADERTAFVSERRDQAYATVSELEYLQRAREMYELADVMRHELLGADRNIHR